MKKFKKTFSSIYILFAIAALIFTISIYGNPQKIEEPQQDPNFSFEFIHGEIERINEELTVTANSGEEEGNTISVILSTYNNFNEYEKGDEILIYKGINNTTGETTYEVSDFYHQGGIIYIFIIFAIALQLI